MEGAGTGAGNVVLRGAGREEARTMGDVMVAEKEESEGPVAWQISLSHPTDDSSRTDLWRTNLLLDGNQRRGPARRASL